MKSHLVIFGIRIADIANTFGFMVLVWLLFGKQSISYFLFVASFIVPIQSFALSRNYEYISVNSESRIENTLNHIKSLTIIFFFAILIVLFCKSYLQREDYSAALTCLGYKYLESLDELTRAYFLAIAKTGRVLVQSVFRTAVLGVTLLVLYMGTEHSLVKLPTHLLPFIAIAITYFASFAMFSLPLIGRIFLNHKSSIVDVYQYTRKISFGGITNVITSSTAVIPRIYLGFQGDINYVLYFTMAYQVAATLVNVFSLNMSTHPRAVGRLIEVGWIRRSAAVVLAAAILGAPVVVSLVDYLPVKLFVVTLGIFFVLVIRTAAITAAAVRILDAGTVTATFMGILVAFAVLAAVSLNASADAKLIAAYLFVAVSSAISAVLIDRSRVG